MMHEEYKNTLVKKEQIWYKMKRLQNRSHQLGTYEANELSLSCFDIKPYILDNGIKTLSCGHKDIS